MRPLLGILLILILCPLLGGLPLIAWITHGLTRQNLTRLGTGNIGVSAAFYHGGTLVGILAVLSEALKGIAAVLLARALLPGEPVWEIVALMALVVGRYTLGKGAGTTNVVWGFVAYDWVTALLITLISGIGFTLVRERKLGKLAVLGLIPLITALRHPNAGGQILATALLSLLMAWIYQRIPDDLDLPDAARGSSRQMFRFFRGDRAIQSLDRPLQAHQVGAKAATLAQLKQWGYPVPMGWVLPPGDDAAPLIAFLHPSVDMPLIVRSSAIGEDSAIASAAGQYDSILNVTSQAALEQAILQCQQSYDRPAAAQYRQDHGSPEEGGMAVLVQVQVQGVFSGVAFSRDPIARQGDSVVIEALPGLATQVVSGQVTPESYRVWIADQSLINAGDPWVLPEAVAFEVEGEGDIPQRLIQQVAYLARHLEWRYHGIPQDIEWSYDGQYLWLLQARPITTLLPIWTRKIAAEVIPGFIHPLTWSVNQPLTCGVWGEIFTVVLGQRASGQGTSALDFNETAMLHHSAAYFNVTLLGQIFQRMGLPADSLEFLTRGAKFSRPPLRTTLQNVPGLLRLARLEWRLEQDFGQDLTSRFEPGLAALRQEAIATLPSEGLFKRIQQILWLLRRATYYSIMAPISTALRQALLRVPDSELDQSQLPEVAALRSLQTLAQNSRAFLSNLEADDLQRSTIFAALAESLDGQAVLRQLDRFLEDYGYLSEVATDIAVPTWREDPRPARSLFTQFLANPPDPVVTSPIRSTWRNRLVQRRLTLKGQVSVIYNQLLAELRWSITALEQQWLTVQSLQTEGDIFFLKLEEIQRLLGDADWHDEATARIAARRVQMEGDRQTIPPLLVYGSDPLNDEPLPSNRVALQRFQGIGVSPGQVEGIVLVLHNLQTIPLIDKDTILVIPYTDAGWAPLLAQAGGLIADVGGKLSHGAIIAREYGIPAVMSIYEATQVLRNGQRVRLDGRQGTVEILAS